MSRRGGWLLLVVGLVLALGAGALVFFVLQEQIRVAQEEARQQAIAESVPVATMKLPVAARPLPPGQALTANDYVLQDFPLPLVPPSAISDTVQLDSKILIQPVGQGETFHARQFVGSATASISQQIEPGDTVFAFPIVDLLGQANVLQDGDRIDLMLTLKPAEGEEDQRNSTAITLQNIRVFKVLRQASDDTDQVTQSSPTALLLAMKPADAVVLKFVKDSGGVIDFALRSPLDETVVTAPSISREELVQRFGFR